MPSIIQVYPVGSNNTVDDKTFTVPTPTQPGSTLVLAVAADNGPSALSSVTDSAGNDWIVLTPFIPGGPTLTFAYCINAMSVTTISPLMSPGDQTVCTLWELSSDFQTFVQLSNGTTVSSTTTERSLVTVSSEATAVLGAAANSTNARTLALTPGDASAGWAGVPNTGVGTSMNGCSASRIFNSAGSYGPQFDQTFGSSSTNIAQTIAFSAGAGELTADFVFDPSSGFYPLEVQFTDRSVSATSWDWDFGDGNTSTEESPIHTYTAPGTYTVSLTVGDGVGTDTMTVVDAIDVLDPDNIPSVTTTFPGTELPEGWSLSDTSGQGSVTVADGQATIHIPAVSNDSIHLDADTDGSIGLIKRLRQSGGDVDVAFQLNTDVTDLRGFGVNLLCFGEDDTEAVRLSWYHVDSTGWGIKFYAFSRAGGSSLADFNDNYDRYMSGLGNWLRIKYVASTGLWTALTSSDGVTWDTKRTRDLSGTDSSFTRVMNPVYVKIGIHQNTSELVTKDVRVGQVVDILERGNDDLRDPIPELSQTVLSTIDGASGSLPVGWISECAGTDTLSWTGTALRLNHDASQNADFGAARAAIRYTTSLEQNWGLLVKFANSSTNSNCYLTLAVGADGGGIDQYTWGTGYGLEVQSGAIRRPIRVDDPTDGNVAESPASSSTDLDETPYTHLAQSSASSDQLIHWVRMERYNGRLRIKEWMDGSAEPSAWNHFDGQDEVVPDAGAPFISLSHNGTDAGLCSFDFYEISFYGLAESTAPTSSIPDGIASSETFGSPQATSSLTASPSGIASTYALGASSIEPGALGVSAVGVASQETFGSLTAAAQSIGTQPTSVPSEESLGSPSVGPGALGVVLTGVGTAEIFGSPEVSQVLGSRPQSIASGESFGTPSVSSTLDVSPTSITSSEAVGQPSATVGSRLSPSSIPSEESFGTPSATPSLDVSVVGIDSAEAVGSPTATIGSLISPSPIVSGESFGTPSATSSLDVSVVGIGSSEAVGEPIAVAGSLISPSSIDSGESFGTPSATSSLEVSLVGIPSAEAFGDPATGNVLTVSPIGIDSAGAVGEPSVTVASLLSPISIPSGESFGATDVALGELVSAVESIFSDVLFGSPSVSYPGAIVVPVSESGRVTTNVDRREVLTLRAPSNRTEARDV